jgi:hypothetical protein
MRQEQARKIDSLMVRLDGGLFPASMRNDSAPLIQLDAVAFELDEPSLGRLPLSDIPPPHSVSVAPPAPLVPVPSSRWHFTAAGLVGGAALIAVCAVAFQSNVPRTAASATSAAVMGEVALGDVAAPQAHALASLPDVEAQAPLESEPVEAIRVLQMPEVVIAMTAEELAAPSAPVSVVAPNAYRAPAAAPVAKVASPTGAPVPANQLAMLGAAPTGLDHSAAAIAIALAGRGAASCGQADGPHGSTPVSVTFAPSGHVSTARVEGGAFAGTPAGSCIARALRSATVHPFEGDVVTVHGSVHVD